MGLVVTKTPDEKAQLEALTAHQKNVRTHAKTQAAKDALAEALADAQIAHTDAGDERAESKANLLSTLQNA